jgi:hypothetical protein
MLALAGCIAISNQQEVAQNIPKYFFINTLFLYFQFSPNARAKISKLDFRVKRVNAIIFQRKDAKMLGL